MDLGLIFPCCHWPSLEVGHPCPLGRTWSYGNTCGVSSPTRVKSRGTLLSYTDGIVTLPCAVTTRSSVPDSTAQATSPGYRSLPPRQHWCRRDSKAKLVQELAGFPLPNRLQSITSHHGCSPVFDIPPSAFDSPRTNCLVCGEMAYTPSVSLSVCPSICLCEDMFWILNELLSSPSVVPSKRWYLSCMTAAAPLFCLLQKCMFAFH